MELPAVFKVVNIHDICASKVRTPTSISVKNEVPNSLMFSHMPVCHKVTLRSFLRAHIEHEGRSRVVSSFVILGLYQCRAKQKLLRHGGDSDKPVVLVLGHQPHLDSILLSA